MGWAAAGFTANCFGAAISIAGALYYASGEASTVLGWWIALTAANAFFAGLNLATLLYRRA